MLLAAALTATLAAAVGAALMIPDGDASDTAAANRISELDQMLRKALVAGDADTVDLVLAPHFELVDPSGDLQTRDAYLRSVSSGDTDYETFDPITPVDVRVSGEVAVVTYESQLHVSAGSIHLQHKAWHTHVYQQTGGGWREVWSQATAVGGFPPSKN